MNTSALKDRLCLVVFLFGAVFIIIGILGFFNNPVLGLFEVNTIHNFVHIGSGLVFVLAALSSHKAAKLAAITIGLVYALVTLLGFVMLGFGTDGVTELLGLVHINSTDNYLHLFLTAAFLITGLLPDSFWEKINTNA